ncbi:peroxiredoxin [Teichococcus vastitatis]|uniref:thioredoxin-dependent peroxiredoxin n=1 Tax=Teichococcus vastitatis TaxID=2307076 RepID=A0ABS9W2A5_9PROT|nr:peroxiredoxin [Pseudoroseomonas vastitatis]MCI0753332.1 peroxiredoxin [Pseudoroseomonas vastitatis]
MNVEQGAPAPDFRLPATGGRTVSPAEFRGQPLVLYFYPKADTSGCTRQACDFQEALPGLGQFGVTVIGVSPDPVPALEKFAAKHGLLFPLASDAEKQAAELYRTWVQKSMYGRTYMGMERSTFLVDRTGHIARIWRKVKVPGHVKAVTDALQELG